MWQFIALRIGQAVLTVWLVTVIVFGVTRLSGDPTKLLVPPEVPADQRIVYKRLWGLDAPLPVQYLKFIGNALRGDFGRSYKFNVPVSELLRKRFPNTLKLALAALLLSAVLAIPLGTAAALYRGTWIDTAVRTLAVLGQGIPGFWLGLVLVLIFAVRLKWLPAGGNTGFKSIVLPAVTLSSFSIASVTRLTRSSMLDVLDSEYIKLVRAKGMPEYIVTFKHALRNAAIPVVTILGLQIAALMGGSVIAEQIFAWPGVGALASDSIFSGDYAVVQTIVLIGALSFVFVNLLVDVLYAVIDPRIRY